mgnify:CR=1 FL=1
MLIFTDELQRDDFKDCWVIDDVVICVSVVTDDIIVCVSVVTDDIIVCVSVQGMARPVSRRAVRCSMTVT